TVAGADPGQLFPIRSDPGNASWTYVWWAQDKSAVPVTERSQFMGDPRHNPNADLLAGSPTFPDGYNWFWDSFDTDIATDFPGIVRKFNRYNGQLSQDVPRLFELLRGGLVNSEAVYTTLTGFSYYYLGIGNEIGYDSANGYASSIPTDMTPFGGGSVAGFVDN